MTLHLYIIAITTFRVPRGAFNDGRHLKDKRIEYLYLYLFLPHPIDNTLVVQYQLVKG